MNKKLLAVIVLIIIGSIFYWYSFRPEQIRKDCNKAASEDQALFNELKARGFTNEEIQAGIQRNEFTPSRQSTFLDSYDSKFRNCLRENGLNQ